MSDFSTTLANRAENKCELCDAAADLDGVSLAVDKNLRVEQSVWLCAVCREQAKPGSDLDKSHLYCLQGAAWSVVPAVQVLCWRLLHRLSDVDWARELLEQMYMEDDVLAWAQSDLPVSNDQQEQPVDSNGTMLVEGDSVTLIKDLDVKGANFTAKRGTMVKNIRVGDDPTHIEGKVNKITIMLKTCFLKKA